MLITARSYSNGYYYLQLQLNKANRDSDILELPENVTKYVQISNALHFLCSWSLAIINRIVLRERDFSIQYSALYLSQENNAFGVVVGERR